MREEPDWDRMREEEEEDGERGYSKGKNCGCLPLSWQANDKVYRLIFIISSHAELSLFEHARKTSLGIRSSKGGKL